MIFDNYKWTKESYQVFLDYLESDIDLKYKTFNSNIIKTNKKVIGNRIPMIRKIAKEISRGDYHSFIKLNTHQTYEEITIHGFIIGYLKLDLNETIKMLNEFVPYIDNWATNDVCASNLKVFKKNQEAGYKYINLLLDSHNPWDVRFGLVLLLCHYIDSCYINRVLDSCRNVHLDSYYVMIANAWLVSVCYIKFPKETTRLLEEKKLNRWTNNKAIQKIRESYRVSDIDKEEIKKYKI